MKRNVTRSLPYDFSKKTKFIINSVILVQLFDTLYVLIYNYWIIMLDHTSDPDDRNAKNIGVAITTMKNINPNTSVSIR